MGALRRHINDILDTATGLQLAQAMNLIDAKLRNLLGVLIQRAEETTTLVAVGRTHGQHGVPTTLRPQVCHLGKRGRTAHRKAGTAAPGSRSGR